MTMWMLIGLALQPVRPEAPPRDLFGLIEGEWVCRQAMRDEGAEFRSETWRSREDGDAQGQIRSIPAQASGTESAPEVELLYQRRGRAPQLVYGLTNGSTVRYRLARGTPQEVVFEALGNGSPRIISYRLALGPRLEVLHGMADGSSRRWIYQRSGLEIPTINCDGRR